MPRVYFDSTVYLALLLGEKGRAESAREALDWAAGRDAKGFISALVVAEVIGAPRLRLPRGSVPWRLRRDAEASWRPRGGLGNCWADSPRRMVKPPQSRPSPRCNCSCLSERPWRRRR